MPRFAPRPDEPAYDDETPEHVQERMRALESLARDLYHATIDGKAEPLTYPAWDALRRRCVELHAV